MEERSFYYRYCIEIPEIYSKISDYFEGILKENSFDIQTLVNNNKRYICLSQKDEQKMLKTAELLKIKKIYTDKNDLKEHIKGEELELPKEIEDIEKEQPFISSKKDNFLPQEVYNDLYSIDIKNKDKNNKRYGLGLFTESEMLLIEKTILEKIPVSDVDKVLQLINETKQENTNLSNIIYKGLEIKEKEKSPFLNENSLFETLVNHFIITDNFPLHTSDFTKTINKEMLSVKVPDEFVRSYFNDEVALYFAWLYHYTNFIIFPSIVSIIIFVLKFFISKDTSENLRMLHAIIIAIWVQFYIISWYRKSNALQIKWNNDEKQYNKEVQRREFVGELKINPVTGKYHLYYPAHKRLISYFFSALAVFLFFCISIVFNIIFFNLRKVFPDDSILIMPKVKNFSTKYRLFERGEIITWIIGYIKDTLLGYLGDIFDIVNKKITDLENHKTDANYNNSFIIKKFIFNTANSFFSIFYLVFILQDLDETSLTIKTSLYTNEFNRIKDESIVPNLKKIFYNLINIRNVKDMKLLFEVDENNLIQGNPIEKNEILKQKTLLGYSTFGDYFSIIQEFCYLTLFASCVPEIGIILLITDFFEIKNDITKLCSVHRRPEYTKQNSINAWEYIMDFIGICSVFSNLIFIYIYNEKIWKNKFSLFTFTVFEHFILGFIFILRFCMPGSYNWVNIYKLRQQYKMERLLKNKNKKK